MERKSVDLKERVMGKIVCFGEPLLRFSPAEGGEWLKSNQVPVYLGGAELNVATALARWSLPVSYCSSLPENELSKDILNVLSGKQIQTEAVLFSGNRIGSYYLAQGADVKNHAVIYDRAYSAFSELKTGMLDWDHILKDTSWFHFSAISPALNDSVAAVCREALEAASKKNIRTSIDLNHRPKLWKNRNPHNVMAMLLPYCDVVMGNIWSAHDLIGIPLDHGLIHQKNKTAYLQHARQTAMYIKKRFARVKSVACTFRFEKGEKGIEYYASLYSSHDGEVSPVYESERILDKVGTGDCFMAGLIYAMYKLMPEETVIRLASAAAFGKFFEIGDATEQEMESILTRIREYE